jgi:hypothetical protein
MFEVSLFLKSFYHFDDGRARCRPTLVYNKETLRIGGLRLMPLIYQKWDFRSETGVRIEWRQFDLKIPKKNQKD